ncbi:hypothetical protein PHLGIDRAFT_339302 [Phlebiopsis gigantea 11061_1 CR5-6]|uniref:Secreted protein n=1 Tax=Phlebiopsis gigantea (strain 11061_1 CR5-6) TaxID=745531 RepID=A0A0C3PQC5_PHLG1|nr:hypothetical protein PHLGIDRAFT_339302 [Phlebiopsis gigantea 11061_1 CR5-6]
MPQLQCILRLPFLVLVCWPSRMCIPCEQERSLWANNRRRWSCDLLVLTAQPPEHVFLSRPHFKEPLHPRVPWSSSLRQAVYYREFLVAAIRFSLVGARCAIRQYH